MSVEKVGLFWKIVTFFCPPPTEPPLNPDGTEGNGVYVATWKATVLPRLHHHWRWKQFSLMVLLVVFCAFTGLVLFKGAPFIGQVAWASDTEKKIKEEVKAAVDPVVKKQDAMQVTLDAQAEVVKVFAIQSIEKSIRETIELWCSARTEREKLRFEDDFNRYTTQWQKQTDNDRDVKYRELNCKDSRREGER